MSPTKEDQVVTRAQAPDVYMVLSRMRAGFEDPKTVDVVMKKQRVKAALKNSRKRWKEVSCRISPWS